MKDRTDENRDYARMAAAEPADFILGDGIGKARLPRFPDPEARVLLFLFLSCPQGCVAQTPTIVSENRKNHAGCGKRRRAFSFCGG